MQAGQGSARAAASKAAMRLPNDRASPLLKIKERVRIRSAALYTQARERFGDPVRQYTGNGCLRGKMRRGHQRDACRQCIQRVMVPGFARHKAVRARGGGLCGKIAAAAAHNGHAAHRAVGVRPFHGRGKRLAHKLRKRGRFHRFRQRADTSDASGKRLCVPQAQRLRQAVGGCEVVQFARISGSR